MNIPYYDFNISIFKIDDLIPSNSNIATLIWITCILWAVMKNPLLY